MNSAMSDANKRMQQFFMQVIELYNAGYTDMEIDYKKKTGKAGKIRILLTDAEIKPTHQAEAKPVETTTYLTDKGQLAKTAYASKPLESATFKVPLDGELRNIRIGDFNPNNGFHQRETLGEVLTKLELEELSKFFSAHLQAAVTEAKLKQSIDELWAIHAANDKALYQYDDGSRVAVIVRIHQLENKLHQLKQEEK